MYNAASGYTLNGIGRASIFKHPCGIYEIHFMFQINKRTFTDNDNTCMRYGINVNAFNNVFSSQFGKNITPLNGGYWICEKSDGTRVTSGDGYGTTFVINGEFWCPARVYTETGSIGMWQLGLDINNYGNKMYGVCYAN